MLCHCLYAQARLLHAADRTTGCATLQLLPKPSGEFRTIYNLSTGARLPRSWGSDVGSTGGVPHTTEPVNRSLAHLLHVFSSLRRDLPACFGTSVLGMVEVHARWRHFVAERRHLAPHAPLRFTSTDLTGCFDTIAQPRLFPAVVFALRLLLASASAPSTAANSRPRAAAASRPAPTLLHRPPPRVLLHKPFRLHHPSARGLVSRPLIDVCGGGLSSDLYATAARLAATGAAHGTLFSEGAVAAAEPARMALSALREHIFCNLVALHGRCYVQRMGVPQVRPAPAHALANAVHTCCMPCLHQRTHARLRPGLNPLGDLLLPTLRHSRPRASRALPPTLAPTAGR